MQILLEYIKQDKQQDALREKICARFEVVTEPREWCLLAACLRLLGYRCGVKGACWLAACACWGTGEACRETGAVPWGGGSRVRVCVWGGGPEGRPLPCLPSCVPPPLL